MINLANDAQSKWAAPPRRSLKFPGDADAPVFPPPEFDRPYDDKLIEIPRWA